MTQQQTHHENGHRLLRQVHVVLMVCGVVLAPLSFVTAGFPVLLSLLLLAVCALVVAIHSRVDNLCLGPYALGLLLGVLLVWLIALAGFYGPHTKGGNEFQTGRGTYVANKSFGQALRSSLLYPATFTAALFGEECGGDSMTGPNCSDMPIYTAVALDYIILAAGVTVGTVLVTPLKKHDNYT